MVRARRPLFLNRTYGVLIHCFVITIPELAIEPGASGDAGSLFVEFSRLGQCAPNSPGDLSDKCNDGVIGMHPSLEASQLPSRSLVRSRRRKQDQAPWTSSLRIAVSPLADAEKLLLSTGQIFSTDKTKPGSQVAGSLELATLPTAARSAVAPKAPMLVISRRATSSRSAIEAISFVTSPMRCSN